jgi:hypothetical protein
LRPSDGGLEVGELVCGFGAVAAIVGVVDVESGRFSGNRDDRRPFGSDGRCPAAFPAEPRSDQCRKTKNRRENRPTAGPPATDNRAVTGLDRFFRRKPGSLRRLRCYASPVAAIHHVGQLRNPVA